MKKDSIVLCFLLFWGCSGGDGKSVVDVTDISIDMEFIEPKDVLDIRDIKKEVMEVQEYVETKEGITEDAKDEKVVIPNGFVHLSLNEVGNVRGMWASQETSIWAVGDGGLILRYNGNDFVPFAPVGIKEDLFGIAGEGAQVVIVGANGTVLRWNKGEWLSLKTPTTTDLYGVAVLGKEDFYVCGKGGVIYHYLDGKWNEEQSNITHDLYGMYGSMSQGIYAVGKYGMLLEKKGNVWISSQIAPPSSELRSIWRSPDGRMFAVGSRGTVVVYNGMLWKMDISNDTYDPPRDLYAVTGFSAEEVYAVGDKGAILRYNGKKWTLMTVAGPYNVFESFRAIGGLILPDGKRQLFCAGLSSKALELDDKVWKDKTLGVTQSFYGVSTMPDGTVIAVGEGGLVLTYKNGVFSAILTDWNEKLNSVCQDIVVGDKGTMFRIINHNAQKIDVDTSDNLVDCWKTKDEYWIAMEKGSVLKLKGGEIEGLSGVSDTILTTIYVSSEKGIWIGGNYGKLYCNTGQGFKKIATKTYSTLRDIWGKGLNDVIVVGDNGLILSCSPDACSHVFELPTTFLYGVTGSEDGLTLAVGWAGTVLLGKDGKFEQIESGTSRVFRSVTMSDGRFVIVGLNGTFSLYNP